ncbi:hypothetical protein QuyetLC_24790 [Bacillus anthracis]|uniref:DUF6440 domain-containing protein n=1 Tax=Bacillus anthracis TaxID=1392 RepID=A0A640MI59_BACAN|nr:hypothetical protein [Enterococcus faecalis]GEU13532.1 hypothetical protein QuyetLC_24790 [Bacillus anthracis]
MTDERFEIDSPQEAMKYGLTVVIITDKITGVQYLCVTTDGSGTNVTPLLDSNGQPMIKKNDE